MGPSSINDSSRRTPVSTAWTPPPSPALSPTTGSVCPASAFNIILVLPKMRCVDCRVGRRLLDDPRRSKSLQFIRADAQCAQYLGRVLAESGADPARLARRPTQLRHDPR